MIQIYRVNDDGSRVAIDNATFGIAPPEPQRAWRTIEHVEDRRTGARVLGRTLLGVSLVFTILASLAIVRCANRLPNDGAKAVEYGR